MIVQDLMDALRDGPLSNLSISNEGTGIEEKNWPKLIGFIEQGLNRLHTRFLLREQELILQLAYNRMTYDLHSRHAQSTHTGDSDLDPAEVYILDQARPFQDDIVKITSATFSELCLGSIDTSLDSMSDFAQANLSGPFQIENLGGDRRSVAGLLDQQLPMNDLNNPNSVFTPIPNQIQVPFASNGILLSIMYQARHPRLLRNTLTSEVRLPELFAEPLISFVASKVYGGMNGIENINRGSAYMDDYENFCLRAERDNLVGEQPSMNSNLFSERGFV